MPAVADDDGIGTVAVVDDSQILINPAVLDAVSELSQVTELLARVLRVRYQLIDADICYFVLHVNIPFVNEY